MKECGVWKFVFSSSATVYGTPQNLPISEDHPVGIGITNPYGRSKFFIEEIIKDLCKAEKVLKIGYLWLIYGLIKIMVNEMWLETDSKLFRDGPLDKLWGGGEFSSRRNFFRYQIPCTNFFKAIAWIFF